MSSLLSTFPPGERQSLEGNDFKDPPAPRQRFLELNLLIRRELTLELGHAKTNCLRFENHPPERWPATIHPSIRDVSAPSEYWNITNSISYARKQNALTYPSVSPRTTLPSCVDALL